MRTRARSPAHGAVSAAALVALVASCVTTTTRYFLPDPANPRLNVDGATDMLEQFLRLQCPDRIAAKKRDTGEARATVLVDSLGLVTRAELIEATGEESLDGLFGTVAAQLRLDAPSGRTPATGHVRIGYSCAPGTAVATVRVEG